MLILVPIDPADALRTIAGAAPRCCQYEQIKQLPLLGILTVDSDRSSLSMSLQSVPIPESRPTSGI